MEKHRAIPKGYMTVGEFAKKMGGPCYGKVGMANAGMKEKRDRKCEGNEVSLRL